MGRQQPKRKASKNKKKWKDYGEESKRKAEAKENPFEVRKQRLRKEVLNSNVRGNVVAPVKSRSLAETKVSNRKNIIYQ